MEISIKNDNLSVCSAVCRIKNDFSTECDVIVPDSKPDIERILQLSANVKVTSCETQNDRVIVSGTVKFNILYLADNEEKSVKSIDASCVFSNLFQHSGIREGMITIADIDVGNLSFNIANCRKLTVKAVLCGKVKVYSCRDVELISSIDGACTKKKTLSSTIICANTESRTNISDSFELSNSKQSIKELLKTDSKITDSDIKIIDDKVIIKGNISVTTLYITESGIDFVENELPFANVIDAPGIRPDMTAQYDAKIEEINSNVSEDANGDLRIIDISADLFFRIIARTTLQAECITDAYIPHSALDCKKSTIEVSGVEHTHNNEINFKELIALPETASSIDTVYRVLARPFIENCVMEEGKVKITGYSEIYILYLSKDVNTPVYSHKENVDFSYSFDSQDCSLVPMADCKLRSVSYTLSGDRSVEIRGCIDVTTQCMRFEETEVVYSAQEIEYTPKKRPSIIISYANGESSLWNIAKEYNIASEDILLANGIESEEEIKEGCALIIPK